MTRSKAHSLVFLLTLVWLAAVPVFADGKPPQRVTALWSNPQHLDLFEVDASGEVISTWWEAVVPDSSRVGEIHCRPTGDSGLEQSPAPGSFHERCTWGGAQHVVGGRERLATLVRDWGSVCES